MLPLSDNQQQKHSVQQLIELFNLTFEKEFNVRLVKGQDEPIYLPAGAGEGSINAKPYAQVVFAHGFFASALHEIAHWCLAGAERRTKVDYGYWYCPDGRTAEQQAKFQHVEVKPQAIEWALCAAANFTFRVSCDNLSGDEHGQQPDRFAFEQDVQKQLEGYLQQGFPARAIQFIDALAEHYGQSTPLKLDACLAVLNRKEEAIHDAAA